MGLIGRVEASPFYPPSERPLLERLFEIGEKRMELTRKRLSGLYFVVDPTMPSGRLLGILEAALDGGVDLVQVWSAWKERGPFIDLVKEMRRQTKQHAVPLIVNNDVVMAKKVDADGVHMDGYGMTPREIRKELGESSIVGYTIGNDLSRVRWAESEGADYISFCSIFPSPSVTECEIVPLDTVRRARRIASIPLFASGGINLDNAGQVLEAGADGIAVISAIQKNSNPETVAREFKRIIDSSLQRANSKLVRTPA